MSRAAIQVKTVDPPAGGVLGRMAWRITTDEHYSNPFDPQEIAIDATFAGPNGLNMTIPAFWMESAADGPGSFFVRFAPNVSGRWKVRVSSIHNGVRADAAEIGFDVSQGAGRGPIRQSKTNPAYFEYQNGEPCFLLGPNISWGIRDQLESFDSMFSKLSAAGGNFARVWMSNPNFMTETVAAGLGRYDQSACAKYDAIFESAERHGIACMVTFNNYRDLRERDNWGPCPWQSLPYATANGGPCTQPSDFISREDCQKLYRQRLRYIVGRYSSYASIGFWEFFNEQTFAEVPIPPSWTIGMAGYLHKTDPYDHVVTTSFGNDPQADVWKSPQIGLTQSHVYGGESTPDSVAGVVNAVSENRRYKKPFLLAELGISAEHTDADYDKAGTGTNLHNGLWAAMMSGGCGGSANWWWDSYIDPKNLWEAFRGAAAFSRQIDWPRSHFEPIDVPPSLNVDQSGAETFSDSSLAASGGWGKSHGQTVMVLANGQTKNSLPHYIFGSSHADLQTPTQIDLTVPVGGSEMVLRISQVSNAAVVRVAIDDQPQADFLVSLLAAGENHPATTRASRRNRDSARPALQGRIDKEFVVPIPEGHHIVSIENLGADWFFLDSATLLKTRSSRYADLEILAMRDSSNGQLIAWLHDTAANWRSEYDGKSVRTLPPAALQIPVSADRAYQVKWWDTRSGKILSQSDVIAAGGKLSLPSPPITRDMALQAIPK